MAELTNQKYIHIARPYALAAFEVAKDKKKLAEWKSFLSAAAITAQDKLTSQLLDHPEISSEQWLDFFASVLSSLLDTEQKHFLQVLSENNRIRMLPQIFDIFNSYYSNLEKISKVRMVTAVPIEDAYKQKLTEALSKRINHEVTLNCDIDPAILGGAIIHMGDSVIDGSVRGKLNRLLQNLTG